ncbi:MAG: gamma-glutamylcyclotransferase family protein [Halocynthiibacter sp.]
MTHLYFFGYGSLVNRKTHEYAPTAPARIRGWRRAWRCSALRTACYLTAIPSPNGEIDGLIAAVAASDLAALDERERAYSRIKATEAVTHALPDAAEISIYAIPKKHHAPPGPDNPVLLSYLDVVVQGYMREFGEAGVNRFFSSTDGWQAVILDDRDAPVYARHQPTTAAERARVDTYLDALSAVVKKL